MKFGLKSTMVIWCLVLGASCIAQAGVKDCSDLKIAGQYQSARHPNQRYVIRQHECAVIVIDQTTKATWGFDLSNSAATTLPTRILAANSHSAAAKKSSESMLFKMNLRPWDAGSGTRFVDAEASINLPKIVPQYEFDAYNPFDIDVDFTSEILLQGGEMSPNSNVFQVYEIFLNVAKAHISKVNDSGLTGALGEAFLAGANYVMDQLNTAQLLRNFLSIDLVRVK